MEDIKRFIGDKLVVDRNMKRLARHKPRMAQWLVGEIARRASGFFWVYLVVKSLINGLRNGDDLAALRGRPYSLPNDVENLYPHILKQIPPEDKENSSKIFLIFRANGNHPDIFTLYRALMFPDYHNVLQLGMYRLEAMKSTEYGQLAWQQYESGARRLGSRYLGLFELDGMSGDETEILRHFSHSATARPGGETKKPMESLYLHRTARGFLEQEHEWQKILDFTTHTEFDRLESLLMVVFIRLKQSSRRFLRC